MRGRPGMASALTLVLCAAPAAFVHLRAAPQSPEQQPAKRPAKNAPKLPRPHRLDQGITWVRNPATGELQLKSAHAGTGTASGVPINAPAIQVRTQMVPVTCIVSLEDGTPVPGLTRDDFRVWEDGRLQSIAYFDASTQPASVALVIDASPSVLPDSNPMHAAADDLIDALAPLDQTAVVDFSAHTYLQLPFSDVREMVRRAIARVDVSALLNDTGGSNIYEAVYLAAHELFQGRTGRKAIVLLTDGEDSGLGLTLDPATASPQPGAGANRLTFDDVARQLAENDVQIFAVSTESRPKIMTPEWLAAHRATTLIDAHAREWKIPPATLYLAELVRRAGGQLFFLREAETMTDTFRQVAQKIRAEYTVGFYPMPTAPTDGGSARPGWHTLRVEVAPQPGARVDHRAAYYIPGAP